MLQSGTTVVTHDHGGRKSLVGFEAALGVLWGRPCLLLEQVLCRDPFHL